MRKEKPPLGVKPYDLWEESFDDGPDLADVVDRYDAVFGALTRYRAAGLEPDEEWLVELGVVERFRPQGAR